MPEKLLSYVLLCTLLSQFFRYLTINSIYRVLYEKKGTRKSAFSIEKAEINIISSAMQKNNWTFKDKLEIVEAIFTIVVSIMAIWGTLAAWQNGFWHKLNRVVDHMHHELVINKDIQSADKKAVKLIKKVEKTI